MHPDPVTLSSWNISYPPRDVTERISQWHLLQTIRLLGRGSQLGRAAKGLENITIFFGSSDDVDISRLTSLLVIASKTFLRLKMVSFCYSAMRAERLFLDFEMFLLYMKSCPSHNIRFSQRPWSSASYGCQHEMSGFSLGLEGGRKIEVEFVIYS
jgi:hypothetical protein